MGQEVISLWSWRPPDHKPAHIRNRTNKFDAMQSPDPLSCDMKDLRKICSSLSTLLPLRIWPWQNLSFVKSLKMEIKQIQNSRTIPCSLGLVFPCSSIAAQNLLKFRSPENILACANDVVGGNDEELPFQGPNRTRLSIAKTPRYPIFLANPPPITLLLSSSSFPCLLSPEHVTSNLLSHPLWSNTKISNVNTSKGYIFPDPNTELTTLLFPFPSLQLPTGANRQKQQYSPDPPPRSALLFTKCTGDVWARCMQYLNPRISTLGRTFACVSEAMGPRDMREGGMVDLGGVGWYPMCRLGIE